MDGRIQLHLAEGGAIDAGHAVMLGQALVQVGVVGIQEVHDAAVFLHDAGEEHLGLGLHGGAQALVKVREDAAVRTLIVQLAQIQPLAGEILGQRPGARIGQHAGDLGLQHGRPGQLALLGDGDQLVVGDGAPQEEGQAGGQFHVGDAVHAARRALGRIGLAHEQEAGRHQDGLDRGADAVFEAAIGLAHGIDLHQRADIGLGHRAAIGVARQGGDNLVGAGGVRQLGRRMADEDLAAAGGVAGALDVEGTLHRNLHHVAIVEGLADIGAVGDRRHRQGAHLHAIHLHIHRQLGDGLGLGRAFAGGDGRQQGLAQRQALGEGYADGAQAGLERHLQFIAVVGVNLGLGAGAGIQIDLDVVGGVIGRIELHQAAAARIQRQAVIGALVVGGHAEGILEQVLGQLEVGGADLLRGLARGQAADLARHVDVALHQRGRDGQDVGDIVEAIAGIIRRQVAGHVDLEAQHVAHGIGIFGAVHAAHGGAAGIGMGLAQRIQRGFQPAGEGDQPFLGRTRRAAQRHLAQAHPAQDLFPGVEIGGEIVWVQRHHRHARGLELVIMAAGAIAHHHPLVVGGGEGGESGRIGGGGRNRAGRRSGGDRSRGGRHGGGGVGIGAGQRKGADAHQGESTHCQTTAPDHR